MATLCRLPLPALPSVTLDPRQRTQPFPSRIVRCWSTRPRAGSGPHWDGDGRFKFNDDAGDLDDRFPFSGRGKRRVWWYDDSDGADGGFEDWDADDDGEFPVFEVLRALGWMIPAIGIPFLLGTVPNTVLMALAVPLAQSILSLVIDKAWYMASNRSTTRHRRSRGRKRQYSRAETATRVTATAAEQKNKRGSVNTSSGGTINGEFPSFGGWDDLDGAVRAQNMPQNKSFIRQDSFSKQNRDRKVSRLGRAKEKPLFLRLLVAAFPFLGSWTRLLY